MKQRALRTALLGLISVLCLPVGAGGEGGPGGGRLYNPETVETLRGVVTEMEVMPRSAPRGGLHVILTTETEPIEVHVGPLWYLERVGFAIELGEELEVRGSRVTVQGLPAIIASRIAIGDRSLVLRNEAGVPLWAGTGGRGGMGRGPWR